MLIFHPICHKKMKSSKVQVSQEKKGVFLRFLKVAGKIFITTVSKKNFQKKVTTTMVDFNNKFLNNSLIDTGIWIVVTSGRIYSWNPLKRNIILLEIKKVRVVRCKYFSFCSTEMEWSVAQSILNIKARGLAHCLLWMKLGQEDPYGVCLCAI